MIDKNKYGKIAIIGAGDLGCQIAHIAIQSGYNIIGFFDDYSNEKFICHSMYNIPLLGKTSDIIDMRDQYDSVVIGIGYKHFSVRASLYATMKKNNIPLATIIHYTAYVDNTASIGEGTVIQAKVVIDKDCKIGNNVFINISSTVAHDSYIGDHSFLSACVAIAGATQVGCCTLVGINATVINRMHLADNIIIGAGAVVVNNLNEPGTYVGVPARKIKD